MLAGDVREKWTAERACPVGLILASPEGTIAYSPSAESYHSWHDGEIFLEHADTYNSDSNSPCAANVIRSGLYEAEVPYGQETCRMLIEMDHAPSNEIIPPYTSIHMVGCTPRAAIPNAKAADKATGDGEAAAAPSRRLLQAAGGASAITPLVEVLNISAMTPEVVFIATNRTSEVLATLVTLAVPRAYAGPSPRHWLITAPESVAIGVFSPHPPPALLQPSLGIACAACANLEK
jgi:hypothetical protein